ncbi:MAG TPA: phage holin family protein [Gemmatimonadaceae bacterium]
MAVEQNDGRRGVGTLLRELAEGSAALVRNEVKLAQLELRGMVGGVGRGTAMVAGGGVLGLLGTLSFFTGLVLLVGDQWLPNDRYWLAALIVTVIAFAIASLFIRRGRAQLSPARLAPDQTVATLKEDKEWLKQRLTSVATSS